MKLNEKMAKIKADAESDEDYQKFKEVFEKEYKNETGDIYFNCVDAAYRILISYKQPICKDHTKPAKFCEDCEALLAKEIFRRIWDLEFDGLDKQLSPEMQKILTKFWNTMQNLRRDYIDDEYWNGDKE